MQLFPGVRLNISKRGISLTIGVPGASANLGENGVTGSVGLPGTGLSYRKTLLGRARSRGRPGPQQAPEAPITANQALLNWIQIKAPQAEKILRGTCWVIDGDTVMIDGIRLRLAGIDAPELDHPWGQRSKWRLVQLCKGQTITARIRPELSYDRLVAECYLPDGRDLAAELVRAGLALDWPKFSGGKYRHLEPADARSKLWRAHARQSGKLRMQDDP